MNIFVDWLENGFYKFHKDIDEIKYNDLQTKMRKNIDWSKLQDYETEDNTRGSQELACKSGSCELVDI